jgi:N-methylhydantoinase A/oxoprolinase/acetone carboxylase beta subunit
MSDFHTTHRLRFSHASEEEPVEIVNLRLKAVGRTIKSQVIGQSHPAGQTPARKRSPGIAAPPTRRAGRAGSEIDPRAAHVGYKPVYFASPGAPHARDRRESRLRSIPSGASGTQGADARPLPTALYERERLTPGNLIVGPAIVFQLDTTTVISPDWAAAVDAWGNLLLEMHGIVAGDP